MSDTSQSTPPLFTSKAKKVGGPRIRLVTLPLVRYVYQPFRVADYGGGRDETVLGHRIGRIKKGLTPAAAPGGSIYGANLVSVGIRV
jgi:hypothetical protein